MSRYLYFFYAATIIIGAFLVLDQLWFDLISFQTFFKVIISLFVLGIAVMLVQLVWRELIDNRKLKKDKYLD